MMTGEGVNKNGDRLLFVASLLVFLLLLAFPAAVADGVRSGLSLSYRAVIPAVFPSIVLTSLLFSRSGGLIERTVGRVFSRLFRVSPRGAVAYVAGACGYPLRLLLLISTVARTPAMLLGIAMGAQLRSGNHAALIVLFCVAAAILAVTVWKREKITEFANKCFKK